MQIHGTKPPISRTAAFDWTAVIAVAYFLIALASGVYLLAQLHRGGSFAAAAEQASAGMLYGVTGLSIVFGISVVGASLRGPGKNR